MNLRVLLASIVFISGSAVSAQADSLKTDTLVVDNVVFAGVTPPDSTELSFSWEEEWIEWCEQSSCVSSDTGLWNVVGEPSLALDTVVMKERLAILDRSSELDLRWNPVAHSKIALYVKRRKQGLGTMIGRAPQYFPLFEEILDREGLPLELKYLTVVESGLNPEARSPAGARGLWQFMYYTAKAEGLRIDSYIDERKDPVRATEAACQHLNRLYKRYGDWYLALAAYNSGSGNVNKAIRRSGKKNYWEVRPFLPKETRNYVPNFLAVVYLMEYHAEYGITPKKVLPGYLGIDTVMVEGPLRFDQMAAMMDLTESEIAAYNPVFRKKIVPGPGEVWPINLPARHVPDFIANVDSMRKYLPELTPEIKYEPEPVYYKVKSGDVLGTIAQRYGVSVKHLKEWNGLKGTTIRVGQRLIIHGDPSKL
ncbi:MAG: lytic transglycosylase [Crocinitomicaceae bacterium]|nr:lytic transglycosylase [Crocinitomicaceae bacterium]